MNTTHDDLARLIQEVSGHILAWATNPALPASESLFNELALRLFAFQRRHNPVLRRLCEARGAEVGKVASWRDIPALPTLAFKAWEVTVLPAGERVAEFHSSGTTGQTPSRHFHSAASLALYELSLRTWFRQCARPEAEAQAGGVPPSLLSLTPAPEQAPHSSLAHMMGALARGLEWSEAGFVGRLGEDGWELDLNQTVKALGAASAAQRPCYVAGTAFSFVHLLDYLAAQKAQFQLPPGSRVMETGGYKGRSRRMPREELHEALSRWLGVSRENILSEYGMCELGSQGYPRAGQARGVFHFPPWARALIVNPETGGEAALGQAGLVRVVDLANAASAVAVQTQDLGIRREQGFELLGRAAQAEARGCSLMAAETRREAA